MLALSGSVAVLAEGAMSFRVEVSAASAGRTAMDMQMPHRSRVPQSGSPALCGLTRFFTPEPARVSAGMVTFEPGARTAWHTHPLGQTLLIVSGLGWVQREAGPIEEVRPGDVVWFPPGLKHWHGA